MKSSSFAIGSGGLDEAGLDFDVFDCGFAFGGDGRSQWIVA
jgi:hypothetical protein